MLKKLLGRHRSLRIGATIVGASALALGFASPALAAQNVNNGNAGNANAQNYLIVEGGSNTAYLLMQSEASLFNASPGCDLVGMTSGTGTTGEQPLDYGCPGLNGEVGTAQGAATSFNFTGQAVTTGNKKYVLGAAATTDGVEAGDLVYDSAGDIPLGDPVKTYGAATGKIKLAEAATGNSASDTITVVTSPQQGENGFSTWGQENPFNDVLVQEPSYGSSNGVLELEGTGGSHSTTTLDPVGSTTNPNAVPVAPLDAARSSRAPKLGSSAGNDFQGLNFVAYAEDAVSYFYWTAYNSAGANGTDAAKCINQIGASNIQTSQLETVYNETYSGGIPNVTWNSAFGCTTAGSSNPVYAYWAQNGSGTESTWATATGASFPKSTSNWPAGQIVFENEEASILANEGPGAGHGAPVGDVMFFESHGRYDQLCPNTAGAATQTLAAACTGTSTTTTPNAVQLGQSLNGVTLNQTSIDAQLPGQEALAFKGDRLLYNVYSNGSNTNIPESNAATLNAISEDGFMCKPSTATDIDPNTGATYHSEIDAAITAQGFTPLPRLQVEDGQGDASAGQPGQYTDTASGIPHPGWVELGASKYNATNAAESTFSPVNQDTDNSAVNGTTYSGVETGGTASGPTIGNATASSSSPVGYCITVTTDGTLGGS